MKSLLPVLTLVAASSAFAQTAPAAGKKSPLQHSVELAYVTSSSVQPGLDDPVGYNLVAKAFVWKNLFLTVEYISLMSDITAPAVVDVDITRLGYGLGGAFEVGPGLVTVSYTLGKAKIEADGGPGSEEADQDRLSLGYSQTFGNGVTAGLAVVQNLNDAIDDETAFILSLGYDFRNGVSVSASFSPNSSDIGVDGFTENVFSLGVKYSF